jgi:hypothetical protein
VKFRLSKLEGFRSYPGEGTLSGCSNFFLKNLLPIKFFKFFYDVIFNNTFRNLKKRIEFNGVESMIKCIAKILASLVVK